VKLTFLTEEARSFAANPLVAFLVPSMLVVVAPRPNLALQPEGRRGAIDSYPFQPLGTIEGYFFFFFFADNGAAGLCIQSAANRLI
jgi:hypothetical protein